MEPLDLTGVKEYASEIAQPLRDRLVEDICRRVKEAGAITTTAEYEIYRAEQLGLAEKEIKAAIDAAVQDGISSKWGGKKPANLKQPLRDGDAERADEAPEYEGMYFLNCNSTQKPGIVDKDLNEILDPDEVYSGCWGRASINFFPFNTNGNKGVGVGLNNIQKLKDDDRLGAARASAESDFGGDDFEDDEDF